MYLCSVFILNSLKIFSVKSSFLYRLLRWARNWSIWIFLLASLILPLSSLSYSKPVMGISDISMKSWISSGWSRSTLTLRGFNSSGCGRSFSIHLLLRCFLNGSFLKRGEEKLPRLRVTSFLSYYGGEHTVGLISF